MLHCVATQRVDVALVDVDMPGMDGIEAAKHLSSAYPDIKILVLTAFAHEDYLGQAIGANVRGFLTKDMSIGELSDCIRRAHAGQVVLSSRPTQILVTSYLRLHRDREEHADFIDAVANMPDHLRPTFHLLVKALANKSIAKQLHLTESTVRSYVSDILTLTGCATRGELAINAVKAGMRE